MKMETSKDDILKRLRRIEGQIKGIHKMIDTEKPCTEVLIQVAAVKAAIGKVGGLVLENYSKNCIRKAIQNELPEGKIEDLIDTIIKFTK